MQRYISIFKDVKAKRARKATLRKLVEAMTEGRWREQIDALRSMPEDAQKDAKSNLPGFTPAAICEGGHAKENVKELTGLVCVDFDLSGNQDTENFGELKELISAVPYVMYCGLSCRGKGYFALMPIARKDRFADQMEAAFKYFEKFGLNPDRTCKDESRFRFVSFDAAPYINEKAKPFPFVPAKRPQTRPQPYSGAAYQGSSAGDVWNDVEAYLDAMGETDLSADYATWIKIGYGFAHDFGEGGRSYFHRFSRNYPYYTPAECDKAYSGILKAPQRGNGATVKSFFALCHANGIRPKGVRKMSAEEMKREFDKFVNLIIDSNE